MSRPTKLSGDLAETIAGLLRRGLPLASIANRVGIHIDTLLEWRKNSPYSGAFRAAEAEAEDRWLAKVEAGEKGPNAKWLLERRFREWWAQKHEVAHSGAVGAVTLDEATYQRLLRAALKESGEE